jgi:hypothetical protein
MLSNGSMARWLRMSVGTSAHLRRLGCHAVTTWRSTGTAQPGPLCPVRVRAVL